MKRRILALLLAVVMLLSVCACSSSGDEEDVAVNDTLVISDDDDTNEPIINPDSNNPSGGSTVTNPGTSTKPGNNQTNSGSNSNNNDKDNTQKPDPSSNSSEYTITLDYGYDSQKTTAETVGGKITMPISERPGYKLVGWFDGSTECTSSTVFNKDTTLKAKWEAATYTIQYSLDGGTFSGSNPTSYKMGDKITVKGTPVRKGYKFLGWYISGVNEAAEPYTFSNKQYGDVIVRAAWEEHGVVLGVFEQDNDASTKDAIEWIALDEKDGLTLVVSKYALWCMPYHSSTNGCTWASSQVRTWCNNTFYSSAFTADEKAAIVESTVKAAGNYKTNDMYGAADTTDKIFILDYEQYMTYFNGSSARKCQGTPYLFANTKANQDNGNIWWWLRNNMGSASFAVAQNDGTALYTGYGAHTPTMTVRPAMWVDLSKLP